MRKYFSKKIARGFTLIELLVVISIIAIIATLATGAAIKSIRIGRQRRKDATQHALQAAFETYRSQQGKWPFKKPTGTGKGDFDSYSSAGSGEDTRALYNLAGGPNSKLGNIVRKLYAAGCLDGSGILCEVDGKRQMLNQVSRAGSSPIQVIYMRVGGGGTDSQGKEKAVDSNKPLYFNLRYNRLTDAVQVLDAGW